MNYERQDKKVMRRSITVWFIFLVAAICLVLVVGAGGKFLYPGKYLNVQYILKESVFRKLERGYSKPWGDTFLCVRDNGELLINYQSIDFADLGTERVSKLFSSFYVSLPELVSLMGEIDGYCFFGKKYFFQIESDLGSMDYHIGYVFFYDSVDAVKRESVFKRNFSYNDMHYENITLKNIDGNWYQYTFVE